MHFFPEERNMDTKFFFLGGGVKDSSIMKRDLNKNFSFVEFSTRFYDSGVTLSLCMFESKGSLFLWAHLMPLS